MQPEANPPIVLKAIRFHPVDQPGINRPLIVRRNSTPAHLPLEWRAGVSQAGESPVAYRTRLPPGDDPDRVLVEVWLDVQGYEFAAAQVRAIDPNPGNNVLGEVIARQVALFAGAPQYEPFLLQYVRLAALGVGAHEVTWKWQFRFRSDDPWTDFATSRHRVYTVHGPPGPPWRQPASPVASLPDDPELPWAEVLDRACDWAAGAGEPDEVAAAITRAVYRLGQQPVLGDGGETVLDYSGGPGYTSNDMFSRVSRQHFSGVFRCEDFLSRLDGSAGGGKVNCADCATVVATFANVLGCQLDPVQIGHLDGSLISRPVRLIGRRPCAWGPETFNFHETTWGGCLSHEGRVCDACLAVDDDPSQPGPQELLPVNLPFGVPRDPGGYLYRFATPENSPGVLINPVRRRRFLVPRQTLVQDEAWLSLLFPKGYRAPEDWHQGATPGHHLLLWLLQPDPISIPGWQLVEAELNETCAWARASDSYWSPQDGTQKTLLHLQLFECESRLLALDFLWQMLQEFHQPEPSLPPEYGTGEVAFADPAQTRALFLRANVIVRIASCGRKRVRVLESARDLDHYLCRPPETNSNAPDLHLTLLSSPSPNPRVGEVLPVAVRLDPPTESPLVYQFFSSQAALRLEAGHPALLPTTLGEHQLVVRVRLAGGRAAGGDFSFVVS